MSGRLPRQAGLLASPTARARDRHLDCIIHMRDTLNHVLVCQRYFKTDQDSSNETQTITYLSPYKITACYIRLDPDGQNFRQAGLRAAARSLLDF